MGRPIPDVEHRARTRFQIRRPVRERVEVGPGIGPGQLAPFIVRAVTALRPADLLLARFSFQNLRRADSDGVRRLRRRDNAADAFLLVDLPPQHVAEQAFPEQASVLPKDPSQPPQTNETEPPVTPVIGLVSAGTRLAFRVTDEVIEFTLPGLLRACSTLPLSVAPHAVNPRRRFQFREVLTSQGMGLGAKLRALGATADRADALVRSVAAARLLEHRLGSDAALATVASLQIAGDLKISDELGFELGPVIAPLARPVPKQPTGTQTNIELPWRLSLSPSTDGGFAHALLPVDHDDRVELWHTRFGIRTVSGAGDQAQVRIDEEAARTVRAIWTRDFTVFPQQSEETLDNIPSATGNDDNPKFRSSLNSRDRMMLVHESSNFRLTRNNSPWAPRPAEVDRLMLTTLGGWLSSDLRAPTLPDGSLTIEEWKHRATLGRDHEVKVVYAGFLFPFGHRASLVKVTERKFNPALPGNPAHLYQRFFIICREQTKAYTSSEQYNEVRAYTGMTGSRNLLNVMPFASVSVLTRVTPDLDPAGSLANAGYVYFPTIDGSPFLFRILAVDRAGHPVEYSAPLMFMERDHNQPPAPPDQEGLTTEAPADRIDRVDRLYWDSAVGLRRHIVGGQLVTYAPMVGPNNTPLDTTQSTQALYFDAALTPGVLDDPQDSPRFYPVLRSADVVNPAMSALAGANDPISVSYPAVYAERGYTGNQAAVYLAVAGAPALSFAGQGDRSGGFVTPNLDVTGLSGRTGPFGGPIEKAVNGTTAPTDFFGALDKAKLFGLVSLPELLKAVGLGPDNFPSFVGQSLNRVTAFLKDLERLQQIATDAAARFAGAADAGVTAAVQALTAVEGTVDAVLDGVNDLVGSLGQDPFDTAPLTTLAGQIGGLAGTIDAAKQLPAAVRNDAAGVARRVAEHLEDAADLVSQVTDFAKALSLPEVVTARLNWSTQFGRWPDSNAVFQPVPTQGQSNAAARCTLDLSVEVQAPVKAGKEPTALVSCSLTPFRLQLIGDDPFIALQIDKIEFLLAPGRKPDVNVVLHDEDGVIFGGPLSFVNTLKDIIPFDGFSDPPYLDIDSSGIKAGFDLAIPTIAIGVFSLANISFGAELRVPFIDDSLDFTFNFCTKENPFRLTVWLFGGGGFFSITVTPAECRVLEAAFEFGAAVALDFGVASGSIECMAGVYFRLEKKNSVLTGYFRLRGEVDVLGLISASIELYLELTYEFTSGKAVGRATLTIEVEIFFLSFSVEISCEKKFKGSNQDPTFAQIMGPPAGGGPGPWDEYCNAFAPAD